MCISYPYFVSHLVYVASDMIIYENTTKYFSKKGNLTYIFRMLAGLSFLMYHSNNAISETFT